MDHQLESVDHRLESIVYPSYKRQGFGKSVKEVLANKEKSAVAFVDETTIRRKRDGFGVISCGTWQATIAGDGDSRPNIAWV